MPEILMNRMKLVGTGYAEMPQDGRRYRFTIERYRTDDGQDFGRIVSMEEVPDVGPYIWIPSYGIEASEAEYMFQEWEHERANPNPMEAEWLSEHRQEQARRMNDYNELRDERAKRVRRKRENILRP